jgi:hypothetical protein
MGRVMGGALAISAHGILVRVLAYDDIGATTMGMSRNRRENCQPAFHWFCCSLNPANAQQENSAPRKQSWPFIGWSAAQYLGFQNGQR